MKVFEFDDLGVCNVELEVHKSNLLVREVDNVKVCDVDLEICKE